MQNTQQTLSPAFQSLAQFAAEYDCGAYGVDTYNSAKSCAEITSASGGLAFTGYDVIVPLALGVVLIVSGIVLIVRRTRNSTHRTRKNRT